MRELVRSFPATAVKSGKCFDMWLCSQRLTVTCFNAFCILCYHLYKSPSWKFPRETFFPEFLSGTFQLFTLVCPSLSIGSFPSSFGFNYCWLSWARFVLFPTLFSQPTYIRYLYRCFPVLLMSHFQLFSVAPLDVLYLSFAAWHLTEYQQPALSISELVAS